MAYINIHQRYESLSSVTWGGSVWSGFETVVAATAAASPAADPAAASDADKNSKPKANGASIGDYGDEECSRQIRYDEGEGEEEEEEEEDENDDQGENDDQDDDDDDDDDDDEVGGWGGRGIRNRSGTGRRRVRKQIYPGFGRPDYDSAIGDVESRAACRGSVAGDLGGDDDVVDDEDGVARNSSLDYSVDEEAERSMKGGGGSLASRDRRRRRRRATTRNATTTASSLTSKKRGDDRSASSRRRLTTTTSTSAVGKNRDRKRGQQRRPRRRRKHAGDRDGAVSNTIKENGHKDNDVSGIDVDGNVDEEEEEEEEEEDCAGGGGDCYGQCWVLAAFFAVAFVWFSGTHYVWTLHPGASRRVYITSLLTRSVEMRQLSADGAEGHGELMIYSVEGTCPLLTGPNITEQFAYEKYIDPGQFAYNRYFLNPGSTIEVIVEAHRAGAQLYMFRGQSSFEAWARERGEYKDNPVSHGATIADSRHGVGRITYLSYQAEYYYVVYRNPFQERAELTATVKRTLTTYDLEGRNAIPSDMCSDGGLNCAIHPKPWTALCVVLQAGYSVGNGTIALNENNIVTVEIIGRRRWSALLGFCSIPVVLLLSFSFCARRWRRNRGHNYHPIDVSLPSLPSLLSPSSSKIGGGGGGGGGASENTRLVNNLRNVGDELI